jgi:hypothetical protein
MTSKIYYYLIEYQNFKDDGFYVPKTAHDEGGLKFVIFLNVKCTEAGDT